MREGIKVDNARLDRFAKKCIMKVVKDILDYLEVILTKDQFELVRKRILRSGNNEVRAFEEVLKEYNVELIPQTTETIVFKKLEP
jgi:hypothetical protein